MQNQCDGLVIHNVVYIVGIAADCSICHSSLLGEELSFGAYSAAYFADCRFTSHLHVSFRTSK